MRKAIAQFIEDYIEHCNDRRDTPLDPTKLSDVLEDFLLAEQWLPQVGSHELESDATFNHIVESVGNEAAALRRLLDRLQFRNRGLRARLERQKDATMMAREHAALLSDRVHELEHCLAHRVACPPGDPA